MAARSFSLFVREHLETRNIPEADRYSKKPKAPSLAAPARGARCFTHLRTRTNSGSGSGPPRKVPDAAARKHRSPSGPKLTSRPAFQPLVPRGTPGGLVGTPSRTVPSPFSHTGPVFSGSFPRPGLGGHRKGRSFPRARVNVRVVTPPAWPISRRRLSVAKSRRIPDSSTDPEARTVQHRPKARA